MDSLVSFAFGASLALRFNIVGNLLGPDVFSVFVVLFCLRSKSRFRELVTMPPLLILAYGAWCLGAMLTDLYQGTQLEDVARGWSKILFFGFIVAALRMLSVGRIAVLNAFLVGISFAWILQAAYFPDELMQMDPWKFGYSEGLTPLVAFCAGLPSVKRRYGTLAGVFLLFAVAFLNLFFNFRSMFGLTAIAGFFCLLKFVLDGQVATSLVVSRWLCWPAVGGFPIYSRAGCYLHIFSLEWVARPRGAEKV
jgi:hypothetical protein